MDEPGECPFCERKFAIQSEFWEHINALSCRSEPSPSSAALNDTITPCRSPKTELLQSGREAVSVKPTCSKYLPEKVSDSVSSNRFDGNARPFDMNEMKINLPCSLPPPPETQPVKPVTNGVLNGNLFSKKEFPAKATESSLVLTQLPKWKCTLCNIEFAEKHSMISHVRSAEHEAKISPNITPSAGDCSESVAQPGLAVPVTSTDAAKNTTTTTDLKIEQLSPIIRQIVREELRSMFQSYFNDNNSPKRSSPTTPCTMETKNSDSRFIKIEGGFIRCEACDCSMTSMTNLSLHIEGKKHRSNVGKLTASALLY